MTDLNLGFQFVLPTPFDWDGFVEENLAKETPSLLHYMSQP
jgi:hypothetical protein